MPSFDETRAALIDELVDVGDLIRRGDDLYEDMGGHLVHARNLDGYITAYLERLTPVERREVIQRVGHYG